MRHKIAGAILINALFLAGLVIAAPAKAAATGDCFCTPKYYDKKILIQGIEKQSDCGVFTVVDPVACGSQGTTAMGTYIQEHSEQKLINCHWGSNNTCKCAVTNDCEWRPKISYCCCQANAENSSVMSQCAVASNYKESQYCTNAVFSGGTGATINFYGTGRCECDATPKYERVPGKEGGSIEYFVFGDAILPFTNECKDDGQWKDCIRPGYDKTLIDVVKEGAALDTVGEFAASPSKLSECWCKKNANLEQVVVEGTDIDCANRQKTEPNRNCHWIDGEPTKEAGYVVQPLGPDGTCNSYLPAGMQNANPQFGLTAEELQRRAKILNQLSYRKPTAIIAQGITVLMSFIGSIALVLYIYAGLLYMFAAGNTERIGKSKQIFLWVTLGVFVMVGSYVIVNFLFESLK